MQGPICRGELRARWSSRARPIGEGERFSRGSCAASGQSSYTPRLLVGPGLMTPALTAAKTPDSTQTSSAVKVSKEDPRTIKRRHAQASPVLGCCR